MNKFRKSEQTRYKGSHPSPHSVEVDAPFYEDPQKKQLNRKLFDECAEQQVDVFPPQKITSAQLRRFFGDIKNLYLRVQRGADWLQIEPLFRMVKSRALYAHNRGNIPREFKDFLTKNIDKVKDSKDFEVFVRYFEAIVGFAYGKGKVKNERQERLENKKD